MHTVGMTDVQRGAANVELVERAMGGVTEGVDMVALFSDESSWAELREQWSLGFTDDCEFAWVALGMRMERSGPEGLRAGWLDWFEPWIEYRSHVEDLRPVGDDRVIAFARQVGIQREGPPVEMRAAAVISIRDGLISRVEFHATPEDAIAAVEGAG